MTPELILLIVTTVCSTIVTVVTIIVRSDVQALKTEIVVLRAQIVSNTALLAKAYETLGRQPTSEV